MTIVDQLNEQSQTLVDAFSRIGQLRDKIVVVSLCQDVIDDATALQDALIDIHFLESVGIRTVVVHGPGRCLQRALQNAGFDATNRNRKSSDHAAIMGIVEKSFAVELNGHLANKFEKIGGRAMTLNFESTPVLNGQEIDAANNPEVGLNLCAFGQVSQVDRLVIENLCYAGQVPFIPAMCLTEVGQKLLVNSDSAAATVAMQLKAEILVTFAEIPPEFANWTGLNSRRLELSKQAVDELTPHLTREMEYIVKNCSKAIGQETVRLIIADNQQRHSILMNIFTTAGRGIQMVGA